MTKKWYDINCTKKDIREMRGFLKTFGIGMRFKKMTGGGAVDYINNIVEVDNSESQSVRYFVSMCLHELWHCICYRQGIYKTYHYDESPDTKAKLKKFRLVALKAEKFVDDKANDMMKVYFPDIPYEYGYADEEDREWYYKYYLDKYYSIK